jgi:diguanylate cyclase (GGDEF)-like protein
MSNPSNERTKSAASVISLANNSDSFRERYESLGGRLLQKLQTTLVLEEILTIFTDEVRQVVNFQRIEYRHGAFTFAIEASPPGRHELDYNLTLQGAALGSLKIWRSYRYKEVEMEAMESLLGSLIYPLRNATLYREAQLAALTDSLTGAANKRAMDYQLQRDLNMANRYQQDLTFLLVDIDHFKRINDTFGHTAGDEVLKAVVERISKCCRSSDTVFRMGGEEFGVILAKATIGDALIIAERMRSIVAAESFIYADKTIPVTISIGCAAYRHDESGRALIERADVALYQAKRCGRNRTETASDYDYSAESTLNANAAVTA